MLKNNKIISIKVLLFILFWVPFYAHAEILEIEYEGFTVWLDCNRKGATLFHYTAKADSGNYKRSRKFYINHTIPKRCQQTSTASYKSPEGQTRYDRGHLVPANHLDGSKQAIIQSNYMINILPQAANMNRGAWLLTEEIIECYRDLEPLEVWGGVVWGDNSSDDHFLVSHGVQTPDAFWKVIIRGNRGIAWIIPNSPNAKRDQLNQYLVNIKSVEEFSKIIFELPAEHKTITQAESWPIPKGCDKG